MQDPKEVDLTGFIFDRDPTTRLGAAIELAARAHTHQRDSAGAPYILHPLRVMAAVGTEDMELAAIAVLHDVREDHPGCRRAVEDLSTPRMLRALELLTHDPKVEYASYCLKLASCDDARRVKVADIRDNLNITRFVHSEPPKRWLQTKMPVYLRALQFFSDYEAGRLRDEHGDEDD